ncbi:sigma-70 family RNA polymerase sigma factor [Streptomyces sp. bgisy084]|uniref:sigma-70 family RNA polymerase sigma factor n=1 Tax=Streptomyces sp. bgisy084 TaxID=3413777 RepID=UPI003D706ADD
MLQDLLRKCRQCGSMNDGLGGAKAELGGVMTRERDGASDESVGAGSWNALVRLMWRFMAEGIELRVALRQVMRAARLDASQTQALHAAVTAKEAESKGTKFERECGAGEGVEIDELADGFDSPEGDSEEGAEEVPDLESLRGTVRVEDHDAARRAARALLAADAKRVDLEQRLLSAEEEVGLCLLFRAVRTPSESLASGYAARLPRDSEAYGAFTAMIVHNQRLVHKMLNTLGYREGGSEYEDLAQHGMTGLIRAVEKFDVSLGCKFSTYATWWIRQHISRAVINEGSFIRLPVHIWDQIAKVRKRERMFLSRGVKPNVEDLALACGISPAKVVECLRLSRRPVVSLELPVSENTTLAELIVDEGQSVPGPEQTLRSSFEREELFQLFQACALTDRMREVLLLRYGFADGRPWTLEEIGGRFGLSRERIRQIEKRAMKEIRTYMGLDPDDPAEERRRKRAARDNAKEVAGRVGRQESAEGQGSPDVGESFRGKGGTFEAEKGSEGGGGALSSQEKDFGRWLAGRMHSSGMDEAELARRLGATRERVSDWLEARSVPGPDLLARVREVFTVDDESRHGPADGPERQDEPPERPAEWYHRPGHDDGGREFGNAAAFAFEADLEVLAREATQNSLDERCKENERPVRVRYTLHELTGDTLARFRTAIRWDDLLPHYEAAALQDQKVGRVISVGLREMRERDRLVLLRVDDYNANGLTGDDYEDGRFSAVVRRQLDSHKSDVAAGGSYGLGKATLWATSRLGLVLMNSTLSEPHEGRLERRLIGRLDLPWREVQGKRYSGPAWLGRPDAEADNADVVRSWWGDESTVENLHLAREGDDPGTSFLIVGAHDVASLAEVGRDHEGDDDGDSLEGMHQRLVRALGRNFWAAMTAGGARRPLLEASVRTLRNGVELIEEERIDPHVHQPARSRALQAFFSGTTVDRLTSSGQVAITTVPLKVPARDGITGAVGEHRAVLLVTEASDADGRINQVTAMRGNRMTVKTSRVPDLPLGTNPFQAVLLAGRAAGEDAPFAAEAEDFLRTSEPPEHNKWGQTEELRMRYTPSAHRRIAALTTETNRAVRELVAIPQEKKPSGTGKVRKRLKITGNASAKVKGSTEPPQLDDLDAVVDTSGAWQVTAEVKVPTGGEAWRMSPVAKLEVRSGPRPVVRWAKLEAVSNCEFDGDTIQFTPGTRRAVFRGVTDVSTHPVRAALTGLVVELQAGKGDPA